MPLLSPIARKPRRRDGNWWGAGPTRPRGHSEEATGLEPVLRQRFGVPVVVMGVVGLLAVVVAGLLIPPREIGLGEVGGETAVLLTPVLGLGRGVHVVLVPVFFGLDGGGEG